MKGNPLPKMTRQELGELVREKRTALGLTQSQLAAAVKWNGVSICQLELASGSRLPVMRVLRTLRYLSINVSEAWLVTNGICPLRQGTEHGREGSYERGCRCPKCSQTHYLLTSARRRRAMEKPLPPPDDPRHGQSSYLYDMGCRCIRCHLAKRSTKNNGARKYYVLQDQEERK